MTLKLSGRAFLVGMALLPVGIGAIAYGILKTPVAIDCLNVNPASEVGARLHCAQIKADQQTPESLTSAIELVGTIPPEEPQAEEGKRLIEQWSIELLTQAETAYQEGNLEKAIDIAESLPNSEVAIEKIRGWKITWTRAEAIEKTAIAQMEKKEWSQAFQLANRLRQLENQHWAKERYATLVEQIQSDRELRDLRLKNPVVVATKPKEIKLIPPKQPIQRPRPSLWKPSDDAKAEAIRPVKVSSPVNEVVQETVLPKEPQIPIPEIVPSVLPSPEPVPPTPEVEPVTPGVEIEAEARSDR